MLLLFMREANGSFADKVKVKVPFSHKSRRKSIQYDEVHCDVGVHHNNRPNTPQKAIESGYHLRLKYEGGCAIFFTSAFFRLRDEMEMEKKTIIMTAFGVEALTPLIEMYEDSEGAYYIESASRFREKFMHGSKLSAHYEVQAFLL
ncbi:hypothetical protein Tco_0689163 [Tanacetum coccineum]